MKLFIIRGVSGSGKTTLSELLKKNGFIHNFYEADMWMDYDKPFNRDSLMSAHESCIDAVYHSLLKRESVAVSNTFTRLWEINPYKRMADRLNVEVFIIKCTGNYKNVHGVPDDVVQSMRERWENYKGEIDSEQLINSIR